MPFYFKKTSSFGKEGYVVPKSLERIWNERDIPLEDLPNLFEYRDTASEAARLLDNLFSYQRNALGYDLKTSLNQFFEKFRNNLLNYDNIREYCACYLGDVVNRIPDKE